MAAKSTFRPKMNKARTYAASKTTKKTTGQTQYRAPTSVSTKAVARKGTASLPTRSGNPQGTKKATTLSKTYRPQPGVGKPAAQGYSRSKTTTAAKSVPRTTKVVTGGGKKAPTGRKVSVPRRAPVGAKLYKRLPTKNTATRKK